METIISIILAKNAKPVRFPLIVVIEVPKKATKQKEHRIDIMANARVQMTIL